MSSLRWLKRLPTCVFITIYLLVTAYFLYWHVVGDSARHRLGYFFTWDMYPGYRTESSRRLVIGETADGRFVQLVPGPSDRFRWGVQGDKTRYDIDQRPEFLREATEDSIADYIASTGTPIVRVYWAEQYWPTRFNLPGDVYESVYEEANPRRRNWRIIDEAAVDDLGRPQWKER